jgi:hypothetical protein
MVSEGQFYTMVDQAVMALDAMEFNDVNVNCKVKNCKYFVRKINSRLDRIILCCESDSSDCHIMNLTLPVVRVRLSSWCCRSDTKKKCTMVDIDDADGKPKSRASPKSKLLPSDASSPYIGISPLSHRKEA